MPTLLAARVVTGAFGGILGGMALAIVGDVFPEHKRGRATGVLMSAFALGVGRRACRWGSPWGIGSTGTRPSWSWPGWACRYSWRAYVSCRRCAITCKHGPHAHPLAKLAETFSQPNHLRAFALVATMMLGGFAVIPYISVYLVSNLGVRETDLPVIYVTGGLLTLLGAPIVGRLADRTASCRSTA